MILLDIIRYNSSSYDCFPYTLALIDNRQVEFMELKSGIQRSRLCVPRVKTIYELFYDLLYGDSWNSYLSDTWRQQILGAIRDIYFFEDRTAFWLSKKERYMMYRQYHSSMSVTVHREADRVAEDLVEPILKEYERKYDSDFDLPTYKTYEEMLKAAETAQIRVPVKELYSFPTADDLATWVFEQIINTEKEIQRCKWCGRYFVPIRSDAQFCSLECHQKQIATGKFCGVKEIKKLYGSIMTALKRKCSSRQKYIIYKEVPTDFSGGYDDQWMLSATAPDSKDISSHIFEQKDFCNIHTAFLKENKMRYDHFRDIYQMNQQHLILDEEYDAEKDLYIAWLKNVRKQLTLFERF